ncbi:mitochondrial branched-chain alpha-ketoacid dehydrogenase kinase domain-containing protein [Sarocladium implicatum]|nr:mitochondrial branched-chain alpha-ketoacid dehydrogenase kinase domain-containing protein [Sarocladium implicatum]
MFSSPLRTAARPCRLTRATALGSHHTPLSQASSRPPLQHHASQTGSRIPSAQALTISRTQRRGYGSDNSAPWRPVSVLDEWVAKEARPISLRQLMVFGRSLTEQRLISSANYVRTELPTRLAHRIRDMQQLPYVVVTNSHINDVYNLYYDAFDTFRKLKEIKNLDDNDRLCEIIQDNLRKHLTVIPKLAMGIHECEGLIDRAEVDKFMNVILKSRISRRAIAEQHLSLTETYNSPSFSPGATLSDADFIGEVFVKCIAKDVVQHCGSSAQSLARTIHGTDVAVPEIKIEGHLGASFPYILSHLEYIVGELLRNSVQAVVERHQKDVEAGTESATSKPPPIEVTICEAPQHIIIRISDRGGGVPRDELPHLWSFSKGSQRHKRIRDLSKVPKMAATMQELHTEAELGRADMKAPPHHNHHQSSLSSMSSSRPPHLRLGMGLPLSRVYAEYWAGTLELHSLEGYGVDAFLQISRLGNKNEQLVTRAAMDAV